MQTSIDISWPLTVMLLSIRLGAMFLMTPILYAMSMPMSIRLLLILVIAVLLTTGLPEVRYVAEVSGAALWGAAVGELALGAAMGLGIMIAFAAFTVGGRLLDVQIGYGIGQTFDPVTRAQMPILSTLFNFTALAVFFAANGHHAVLRGFASVLEKFPVGRAVFGGAAVEALVKHVAAMFALGFALVAPVVLALLLLEAGLGMLSRSMPQINMFLFGIPIKIVVGLVSLALWMGSAVDTMSRIYASIFQYWEGLFR